MTRSRPTDPQPAKPDLRLDVDALESGAEPLALHFEISPAWWAERRLDAEAPYELAGPIAFELGAHKIRSQVHLEGRFATQLDEECSRCLARYRLALREDFRLVLDDAGERIPGEPESAEALERDGMCLGEELEAGLYRGSEIRLDRFFAELVSVAIPIQPVCREDCLGLCPQCGANRNETRCECEAARPESPFAVLKNLELPREGR